MVNVLATFENTVSFFWDFESRAHADVTGDVERRVLETRGNLTKVVLRRQKLDSKHGGKHHEREFVNEMSLHTINDDTIVIVLEPKQSEKNARELKSTKGLVHGVEHAEEKVVVRFSRRREMSTKIEFVIELELGMFVSRKATKLCLERHLDEAADIQRYFAHKVQLQDMTEKAGEVLGHDMAWNGGQLGGQHSRGNRAKHVEEVIVKSKALSAVREKYPWIVTLMQRAREGALAINNPVATKLECLSKSEARIIGNNLMSALKSRKVVAAGVDQWRGQNRAINELLLQFPWMKALFEALGQSVANAAPWGLRWR